MPVPASFLAANSSVLVTGINSYVGAHIARELLHAGFVVIGTVRSQDKANAYLASVPSDQRHGLSTVIVPDLAVAGSLETAVEGVDAVVHVASPFHVHIVDNERDMLLPTVRSTETVMAAVKASKRVRRVLIISSFVASVDLAQGYRPGYTYSERDWNPTTWEEARTANNPLLVYCASKQLAERAAFAAVDSSSSFDVVSILPPFVFGPSAFPPQRAADLGTSLGSFWDAISGEAPIPPTAFPIFVDVRDVATACRRALEVQEAGGQRFHVCAGNFTFDAIAHIIKHLIPSAPAHPQVHGATLPKSYTVDSTAAQRVLGVTFTDAETTFVDTAQQLLRLFGAESAGRETSKAR